MKVIVAKPAERKTPPQTLKVGDGQCFRLTNVSFEDAIAADEGPYFYIVIEEQKDGLVTVIGIDGKGKRKLP